MASGRGEERNPPAWSALSLLPPRISRAFETYFSTPPRMSEGRIKVLPWRVVLTQRDGVLKDGGAVILAGVSSKRLCDTEVIPTHKRA